jgi:hypothetical protein
MLATLVLVGTVALRQAPLSSASVHTTAQPKTINFEVQALPADAQILLDGKLLGTGHIEGSQPAADRKVSLEVRASGHLTERKVITLTRDMSVQIVLAPEPAAAASVTAPAAADSSAANAPLPGQASPRAASKPASAPRNRSAKCNPPYVFAADGVKTYKPECF